MRAKWWGAWATMTAIVSAQHVLWALLLLYSSVPRGATPLSFANTLPRFAEVIVLLIAAVAAVWSAWHDELGGTAFGKWLAVPQQCLVVSSAVSSIKAILAGHYADLEPRPREFIAADQGLVVLVAVVHTVIMVAFHGRLKR